MSTGANQTSRTRFSLASLLLAVTAIGGCLAALQFKSRVTNSDWFGDDVVRLFDPLPISSTILLVTLQIVTLGIAVLVLFISRKPGLLWVYVAGHSLWLLIIVLWLLFQDLLNRLDGFSEPCLMVFFFEPSCAIVFAGLALCQSLFQRNVACSVTVALIVILSLVAELCAILELSAFAAALGAGIAMSSR